MELLARFELATVSRRAYARREPSDLAIEKADEAASYAEVTKNLRIVLIRRKFGAASQIRTGDLILTKFECNLLVECLLMPADAPKAIVIQRFSKIIAIPRLCQLERPIFRL